MEENEKKESQLNTGMTLYEMNKRVVAGLPALTTPLELDKCKSVLRKFKHLGYFMLMCREDNYYTVIKVRKAKNPDKFEDLVIELLQSQGAIKDIDYSDDKKSLECWVQKDEEDPKVYMLFPYGWGVIECQ